MEKDKQRIVEMAIDAVTPGLLDYRRDLAEFEGPDAVEFFDANESAIAQMAQRMTAFLVKHFDEIVH